MTDMWLTHPDLTPDHDFKAPRGSLGAWARSGWREREDQTDGPGYAEEEAARLTAAEEAAARVGAEGAPTTPPADAGPPADTASTTRPGRN